MNQSIIYILFGLLFATVNGATFVGCSASQQNDINSAATAAHSYAAGAFHYLISHRSGTPRYTTWFGTFDKSRHDTIESHFDKINRNDLGGFTYDCSTCTETPDNAYVYANQYGRIFFCGGFWSLPMTGTDSKGGTILSVASQFTVNGGTKELSKGQADCRQLATSNPDGATNNANSYEYFAENNPPLA